MRSLEYPALHTVNAAHGWIELGCLDEAAGELESLPPEARRHPDVLELEWKLHARRGSWERALHAAEQMVASDPARVSGWVDRSYSLHELKRTREAMEMLAGVYPVFEDEFIVPYNLACYACQLGDLAGAKSWLERACQRGDKARIKQMALGDRDLMPMWGEIERL